MCGRYYIETESESLEIRKIFAELNSRFLQNPVISQLRGGEIFPTQVVPVIRPMETPQGVKLLPDLMQWGIPGQTLLINARAETASQKPTFRQSLQSRRILIPATSFFEWQKRPDPVHMSKVQKQKYVLSRPDKPVFYMAGLYLPIQSDQNPNGLTGQFVILTGAANSSVSPIHDRMPLVLPRQLLRHWLQQDDIAQNILAQPIQAFFTANPV